jgi:rSAM/selenodomain-associated transferase 1
MHELGVFAKQPTAGAVKTRLARETSPTWAGRVAEAFLADTLDRVAAVGDRRVVAFAPAEAWGYFHAMSGGRFDQLAQADGDLGRRLHAFFEDRLGRGARAVVVIGTDSPTLPVDWIARAFELLAAADLVLGPAADGGYYLIGCARPLPAVFDGIAWGSATVLGETVRRLAPSRRLVLLPPWYDVDTLDDWRTLRGHLRAMRRGGIDPGLPHTEALLVEDEAWT